MVSGNVFGFFMFGRGVCFLLLDPMEPVAGGEERTYHDAGIRQIFSLTVNITSGFTVAVPW